jgi:transposase-like protein
MTNKRVSIARLARESDVTRQSLHNWLNGTRIPHKRNWERVEIAMQKFVY